MTKVPPNDLNFGHFGVPAYDLDNSQWAFARTSHGSEFRQLGGWKPVVPAAVQFPSPRLPRTLRSAQQATWNIARNFPELVPAAGYIPELESVSAAATAALSTHDPAMGQLMSFGSITPPESRARFTRQAVATPTGENGSILRVQLLMMERHGWGVSGTDRKSFCYLEGPSMKGEYGFWNEDAAPIQQICFAQSEEPSSFLAVRLPQRIALFHPVYHRRPEAAAQSPYHDLPPSVIEIRPFHSVWIKDTGNAPHADVSFNPHYQRQFAIVDINSSWSVWDIDGKTRAYTVRKTAFGNMNIEEELHSDENAEIVTSWKEDGWARIMWVGDANTILVCNRRRLELVDLKGSPRRLRIPQVIDWSSTKNPDRHWILDMKRNPSNDKEFFVLTSIRLYLMAVTSVSEAPRLGSHDFDVTIVLSWTHFRAMEDITLQLNVQRVSEQETIVFVHSRLSTLITVYRLIDQPSTIVPYCTFGPTMLRPYHPNNVYSSKLILNFGMAGLDFKARDTGSRGLGQEYLDRGFQFYHMSAVFDDLSVAQTVLYSLSFGAVNRSIPDVAPTTWTTLIRPPTHRSNEIVSSDEDDFVEPDGLVDAQTPLLKPAYQLPEPLKRGIMGRSRDTFSFTILYQDLVSSSSLSQGGPDAFSESVDMAALVEDVKTQLERRQSTEPFMLGTMQEYAKARVTMGDIDEASAQLQELSLDEDRTSPSVLEKIASDHILGFQSGEANEPTSLASVYDLLLQNWVAPLPAEIPVRLRQRKDHMAQQIATGVVLGSTRVRRHDDRADFSASDSYPSQDSAIALPSSLPQHSSHSVLPLPPFQSSKSNTPTTSHKSDSRPSNPLARLAKHLLIETQSLPSIPPSITQVLSHWDLGADPATYDWETMEREAAETVLLSREDTEKMREKSRRKKERRAKRQRREDQMYTEKVGGKVESQPQMPRSSPGPIVEAGSSQVPGASQGIPFGPLLVQSQAEPGKHGGRPGKKKKGKSRMSGF